MKQLYSEDQLAKWKRKNKISVRKELILSNANKYENLDDIMIALNLKCRTGFCNQIKEYNRNIKSDSVKHSNKQALHASLQANTYLYMMKIYYTNGNFTNKVKIGISDNPSRRSDDLNKRWSKLNLIFNIYLTGQHRIQPLALKAENIVHEALILVNKQYTPSVKLDGLSEMFHYEEWIDNLIT